MKKIILFIAVIFSFSLIHAQTFISNSLYEANYDHQTEKWVSSENAFAQQTSFEFSAKGSVLKITTPKQTATYTVKSVFDNKTQYEYEIVNEKGEEFILIIDNIHYNIRFITMRGASWKMIRYNLDKVQ